MPMWRSRARGTCWPDMRVSSRWDSTPMWGSAATSCSPSPCLPRCRRCGRCRLRASSQRRSRSRSRRWCSGCADITSPSAPGWLRRSFASSPREFLVYWIALALVVLVLGLIISLLRSRYGLALTAIRDNEVAALSNGVSVRRVKFVVYVTTAFCTAMVGAVIFLQKLRISPDAAFSINDWTAYVIFIAVIGGIGRIEGPIVGAAIFFLLRQLFADLGSLYLIMLGAVAILIMLKTPRGVWGLVAGRFGLQIFPLQRRLVQKIGLDIKQETRGRTS